MKARPNITDAIENAGPDGWVIEVDAVKEMEVFDSVVSAVSVLWLEDDLSLVFCTPSIMVISMSIDGPDPLSSGAIGVLLEM